MTPQLAYRIPDIAKALGMSPGAVRQMILQGLIPTHRLGKRVFVLPEELEQAIKGR